MSADVMKERQHEQSAERRERLMVARDAVVTAAIRYATERRHDQRCGCDHCRLMDASDDYIALLISDRHPLTEDERRAARLLGLMGEEK